MKAVVDRSDDPLPPLEPDLLPAAAPPSRARFALFAIVAGLLAGGLLFALLLPDGGWPALVLLLSLGLSFSSLAAMLVFRRVQLPLEDAHGRIAALALPLPRMAADAAADSAPPPADPALSALAERLATADLEVELLRLHVTALSSASGEALLLVNVEGRIERASPAAAELVGLTPEALFGRPLASHFPLYDDLRDEPLAHPLTAAVQRLHADPQAGPLAFAALLERRGRTSVSLRVSGLPLRDPARRPRGALLRLLARGDASVSPASPLAAGSSALDGLCHRIDALQLEARLDGVGHALLLVGADGLDALAGRLGFAVVAQRLWLLDRALRELTPDLAAPVALSEDCWALLLPRCAAATARARVDSLRAAVAALPPAVAGDDGTRPAIRVGLVLIDGGQVGADVLLEAAHAALRSPDAPLPAAVDSRVEASRADWLRRKLAERAIRLAVQPILPADAAASSVDQDWVEVLPRFEDDDGVWLPAEGWLPELDRLGLAAAFELAMLEAALAGGPGHRRLLIRLSPAALARDDHADALLARLARSDVPGARLGFAIDAAAVLAQPQRVAALHERLLPLGVAFVLDGCSRAEDVEALRLLPAGKLRLSLIDDPAEPAGRAALAALVAAARAGGAQTIATGVADADTRERLRLAGVDQVQGPAIAPPTPFSS
jgi:EAL domain-containing protein (putative c-di-GMP-specific phosphodiesterase class I)/PAS domain-containing protein/GGDEF domain-containing protein